MTARHIANIPHEELQLVASAARAMRLDEVAGEALQLRTLTGGRQWIIESSYGQVVANITDATSTPAEDSVFQLSERVCRFAECFGGEVVSLRMTADHTVTADAADADASVELVPSRTAQLRPWAFLPTSSVVVGIQRFRMLLWCARCTPSGFDEQHSPHPPMWLQLGDGTIELHVDWSALGPTSASYRMGVGSHEGHGMLAIPHEILEPVLRPSPHVHRDQREALCTISIGTVRDELGERDALAIDVGGWRLILLGMQQARQRWSAAVDGVLADERIKVASTDGIEWAIDGDHEVRVELHHGHPDVARVSAVLLRGAEESMELFRQLAHLNAESNHIRYWLDDGAVRSGVDVECTELQRLPDIVRQVKKAAAKHAPALATVSGTT